MKHGKKPTREQRKLLMQWNMDPVDWLVVKDTPDAMQVTARNGDQSILTLHKGVKK